MIIYTCGDHYWVEFDNGTCGVAGVDNGFPFLQYTDCATRLIKVSDVIDINDVPEPIRTFIKEQ